MKMLFAFTGSFITGAIISWAVPWFFAAAATELGLKYWIAAAFQSCLPYLIFAGLGLAGYAGLRWIFFQRDATAVAQAHAEAQRIIEQAQAQAEQEAQRRMEALKSEEEEARGRARKIRAEVQAHTDRVNAENEQIREALRERALQLEEKRKSYRADLDRAEAALREKNLLITKLINALDKKKKASYERHRDNPGRIKRAVKPLYKALAEAANQGFEPDHG